MQAYARFAAMVAVSTAVMFGLLREIGQMKAPVAGRERRPPAAPPGRCGLKPRLPARRGRAVSVRSSCKIPGSGRRTGPLRCHARIPLRAHP